MSMLEFNIVRDDITSVSVDVIVLKYAQAFHGADARMASALDANGISKQRLKPAIGQHVLVETRGSAKAPYTLFIGVPPLYEFTYDSIHDFSRSALAISARAKPDVKRIALTLHGVGFGLDETASFQAELDGLRDAWDMGMGAAGLQTVLLVDHDARRVERLKQALAEYIRRSSSDQLIAGTDGGAVFLRPDASAVNAGMPNGAAGRPGRAAGAKAHAFVAMPFSDDLKDAYYYGIQNPVHQAGLLCERMDHTAFTGDIMTQVRRKIENASVVIAVLTGANPNVYLEVGYAWGKEVPTILLIAKIEDLAFDVKGSRCLTYSTIMDLEEQLGKELSALQASGELVRRQSRS